VTVTQDIRTALEVQLKTIATLPTNSDTGFDNISWENRHFIPKKGETYIRLQLTKTSSKPASAGVTAPILHEGLLILDIFLPDNEGPFAGDKLADEIVAAFNPQTNGLVFNGRTVSIRSAERFSALSNPPFYLVPVSVQWFSYV